MCSIFSPATNSASREATYASNCWLPLTVWLHSRRVSQFALRFPNCLSSRGHEVHSRMDQSYDLIIAHSRQGWCETPVLLSLLHVGQVTSETVWRCKCPCSGLSSPPQAVVTLGLVGFTECVSVCGRVHVWVCVRVAVCLPCTFSPPSRSSLEDDNGGDEEWSGDKLHGIHDALRCDVPSFQWGDTSNIVCDCVYCVLTFNHFCDCVLTLFELM